MSVEALAPRSRIRTKANVAAELVLADGTRLTGSVFLGLDERMLDLLNAPAAFLPFRDEGGEMLLLNKSSIAVCRPLDARG